MIFIGTNFKTHFSQKAVISIWYLDDPGFSPSEYEGNKARERTVRSLGLQFAYRERKSGLCSASWKGEICISSYTVSFLGCWNWTLHQMVIAKIIEKTCKKVVSTSIIFFMERGVHYFWGLPCKDLSTGTLTKQAREGGDASDIRLLLWAYKGTDQVHSTNTVPIFQTL